MTTARPAKSRSAWSRLAIGLLAGMLLAPALGCDLPKQVASVPAPLIFDDIAHGSRTNSPLILVVMDDGPF